MAGIIAASAADAVAQRPPARWQREATRPASVPFAVATTRQAQPGMGRVVAAGMLGAVLGFAGGALLGYQLERDYFPCYCDDPGLMGLLFGAVAGPTLAVPTAVHLAGGRRGPYLRELGVSALIGGIALGGMFATRLHQIGVVFLFGAPVVQVVATTLIERDAR